MPDSVCSKECDLDAVAVRLLPPTMKRFNGGVALTGGSGRVGRLLRTVLRQYVDRVRVIDLVEPDQLHANETWEKVDISDFASVKASLQDIDAIIHLAGFPNERKIEDVLRINVMGTHNIYEAARHLGIKRVVLGSSNHVTGFYEIGERVDPLRGMRPDSFYGLSKCWNELEAGLYYDKYGVESLIIRIGNATLEPDDPRSDGRSHTIWVSPRDLAQLVLIGLQHSEIDCMTVYGASQRKSSWWDNTLAFDLGYDPQDGIENSALLESLNSPLDQVSVRERFQGGRFCAQDHDGVARRRKVRQKKQSASE
jgi:uronate dehydrogenase